MPNYRPWWQAVSQAAFSAKPLCKAAPLVRRFILSAKARVFLTAAQLRFSREFPFIYVLRFEACESTQRRLSLLATGADGFIRSGAVLQPSVQQDAPAIALNELLDARSAPLENADYLTMRKGLAISFAPQEFTNTSLADRIEDEIVCFAILREVVLRVVDHDICTE